MVIILVLHGRAKDQILILLLLLLLILVILLEALLFLLLFFLVRCQGFVVMSVRCLLVMH